MYSIVLVMALGNGAAAPAWSEVTEKPGAVTHELNRHRHRGHGCCGCSGGGYSGGCYGGGYAYGGCSGGYAGYGYGCTGGLWGSSYGGCTGGYYGYSSGGYGSAYSGYGSYMPYGGLTGYPASGSTYYGSDMNNYPGMVPGGANYNNYNNYNSVPSDRGYDRGTGTDRGNNRGTGTNNDLNTGTDRGPGSGRNNRSGSSDSNPGGTSPRDAGPAGTSSGRPPQEVAAPGTARLVVTLPADARLTIDDTVTNSTSGVRKFITPPLEAGHTYSYTLKAEVIRDGRTVTETKKVPVRIGEETRVDFQFQPERVASK